jgi:cytochrome c-type biogenesis protein CcmF
MVVHLGVVLIAVAFAASQSYDSGREVRLRPGESASVGGHTVTYLGSSTIERDNKDSVVARVRIDDGKVYAPQIHRFPFATQGIGSPSVKTGLTEDVYLTLVSAPTAPGRAAVIGVFVQPLILWLWVGGLVMGFGTALAAWPGRRGRHRPPPSEPRPVDRTEYGSRATVRDEVPV